VQRGGRPVTLSEVGTALDLKHIGLIVSAAAAVALRFLSDFGLSTIEQNAAVAGLDVHQLTAMAYLRLVLLSVIDALQRDWFHLAPQAPWQVVVVIVGLVVVYVALRRRLSASLAATAVLLITPLVPLVATAAACAVILIRASRAG